MAKIARIEAFEALRGLLALWVVLNHMLPTAGLASDVWPLPFSLMGKGGFAVEVFIILSGFVIFYLLDTRSESYWQFIIRRAFRLFPVYWICLLISVCLVPLMISVLEAQPWHHPHTERRLKILHDSQEYFWPHLAAHIPLFHGLVPTSVLPSSDYAFIGQAWSISLEWQFYLVAPFVYLVFARNKPLAVCAMILLLIFAQRYLRGGAGFLPNSIDLFFVGAASYFAYKFVLANKGSLLHASTTVVLMPIVLAIFFAKTVPVIIFSTVFSLVLGKELLPNSSLIRWVNSLMTSKHLVYLGSISYSIYMSHMIVLYCCAYLLSKFELSQWEFFFVLLGLVVSITIGASAILYKYVECPSIDLGKKLSKRCFGPAEVA